MSLTVGIRKVKDVVIMDVSGRLTVGEPVTVLTESIRVHLQGGYRKFVLNLSEVEGFDSSALGHLVSAYSSVRNEGGDVKLVLR